MEFPKSLKTAVAHNRPAMKVELYVYDLSQGMAAQLSLAFVGTYIDIVPHTSVVINGVEVYFGQGILKASPGGTHLGSPLRKIDMGETEVSIELLNEYLQEISSEWTPESYSLLTHNCNHFSNELCQFLVGKGIPQEILAVAETVAKTPLGQMLGAVPPPV